MDMLQPMLFAAKTTNEKRYSKRFTSNRSAFLLATYIIFFSLTCIWSANALALQPPAETLDVKQVLVEGRNLEQQGLWGEALSVYQSALKADPNNETVKTRRAVARIHYDLERRAQDSIVLC